MCVQCDIENAAMTGEWDEVIRLGYLAKQQEVEALYEAREKEVNEVRAAAGRMLQEKDDELERLREAIEKRE